MRSRSSEMYTTDMFSSYKFLYYKNKLNVLKIYVYTSLILLFQNLSLSSACYTHLLDNYVNFK